MMNIDDLLDKFRRNRYEPSSVYPAEKIPDRPGNYILCLRRGSKLRSIGIEPTCTTFEGLDVIYTGMSSDLRRRDYHKHFIGNNAGQSTLRKSLGVLFGYRQIPRDKARLSNKTKFCSEDEQRLTEWMRNNLVMFYLDHPNFRQIEGKLINHYNPPLNLRDNHNPVNLEFRKQLSQLRRERA
jgi:hypothetical protein